MPTKTVCIIGAGPAGLVAAKTLLETGGFEMTVFEKAERIGGIWALDEHSTHAFLAPETPTNLSRYSVGFSDFSWDSIDWSDSLGKDAKTPMFPKAWQANRYLEAYRKRHIPDGIIRLSTKVVRTRRLTTSASGKPAWEVTTIGESSQEETTTFDHLIVASGFFSQPRPLDRGVEVDSSLKIKIAHSSKFKTLDNLLSSSIQPKGSTILIYGGGNSAGEAAAAVAQQISHARYSPETGREQTLQDIRIVHVTPQPFYAVPPYVPAGKDSYTFLPVDLKLYDLSRRANGPITGNAGQVSREVKDMIHESLSTIVGGDQADLGSEALRIRGEEPRKTAQVALSESYPEFVRSGMIEVIAGRVTELRNGSDGVGVATIVGPGGNEVLEGIGGVLYATGYSPGAALEFLPEDVKGVLQYDPQNLRLPLILEGWQSASSSIPDLALHGFYEGPYWGMMEMQARITADRWTNGSKAMRRPYEEPEKLLAMRAEMQQRGPNVPQFWFGDYLGYLEEIAAHLKLQRNDGPFSPREGCVSPARYLSAQSDTGEASKIMQDLHATWNACLQDGKFIARAAFRALHGNWKMSRTINSALASFPSGTLEGTASFHPRFPTADKSRKRFDLEYLYIESGSLTLSNGYSMPAKRRYVYRYSEARDELSVWFVKPDNDLEVDYLFHNLSFIPPKEAQKIGAFVAKADHLCVKDMYWTEYTLPIQGITLHTFTNKHTVKGPSKDYVATTHYSRMQKQT